MRLFDAHTHIDMRQFQNDREAVIKRAKKIGLEGMVTSSIGPGSFRRTLGIVEKHKGFIHHSAGCGVSRLVKDDAEMIIALTRKYADQIVAIGEVGLDYHWVKDASARKGQEPLFQMFIDLAKELDLPIVIHSRKAEFEATQILEREFDGAVLMHCFDGSPDVSERIRDNGWYITLPANFTRYRNRVEAARIIPLEQIMLETDGPYLSPTERRNEPANISFGVEKLAGLLDLQEDEVGKITTKNAIRFYRL
ncbi:MAG: TatD family hydrolase [Candidatus Thorarchaeota archaeon]